MFETGVTNRNLAVIYEANKVNKVSVITPGGKSETKTVESIVMQGETLAPLECSVTVDTIGKECVDEDKYLFKYKYKVKVPPLTMVDDIITVSKCGSETGEMNAFLNAKTNVKKLQYGETKCVKMHVGKDKTLCPEVEIDTWKMKTVKNHVTNQYELIDEIGDIYVIKGTDNQLYLGDYLACDGSNKINLTKRKQKGLVIINKILSTLEDGFYGKHFFEAAILMRESLFLNSILLNTEVCYNLSLKNIKMLEVVDNRLIRGVLKCYSGTPVAIMFLELALVPIRFLIMKRRINFLHYILRQDEHSLVYNFFKIQSEYSVIGDWADQVKCDLKSINIDLSFEDIKLYSKEQFRELVNGKIKQHAYKWLLSEKDKLSSAKDLHYNKFEVQSYFLSDELTRTQKMLLFQMR